MKIIYTKKKEEIIVDNDLYDELSKFSWFLDSKGYALTRKNGKKLRMHRIVNNTPLNFITDHINGNKSDNQKSNLRTCDKVQNARNQVISANNTSGYKGVTWDKQKRKWRASIYIKSKKHTLGRFSDIKNAITAYNQAAQEHFGEFARLN